MKKKSSKFWQIFNRIICALFVVLSCAISFVGCDTSGGDWDEPSDEGSEAMIDWQSFSGIKMLYTANPNRPDATKTAEAQKLISMFEGVADEVLYKIAFEYGLGYGASSLESGIMLTDYYNVLANTLPGEGLTPAWTVSNGTVYTKADVTGTDASANYTIKTGFAFGKINLPAEVGTQKEITKWTNFASTSISDTTTAAGFLNSFINANKKTLIAEMLNQNLGLSGTTSALSGSSSDEAMLTAAKKFNYYGLTEAGVQALAERISTLVNNTETAQTTKGEDYVKKLERTVYSLNEGETASATQPASIVKVGDSYYVYSSEGETYTAITIADESKYTAGEKSVNYYVFDVNHDGLINNAEVTLNSVKAAKTVTLNYKNIANFVENAFDEALENNVASKLGGATYYYNIYVQDYSNLFLFMQDKAIANDEIPYIPEENYVGMIYMFSDTFGTRYAESILMSFDTETDYNLQDFKINFYTYFSPKGTGAVTTASKEGFADNSGEQVILWDELGDFEVKTSGGFTNLTPSGDPDIANGNPNALKLLDTTTGIFNPAILAHMKQIQIGEGENAKTQWQWVDETNDVLSLMFEATVREESGIKNVPTDLTFKIGNIVGLFFNKNLPSYS